MWLVVFENLNVSKFLDFIVILLFVAAFLIGSRLGFVASAVDTCKLLVATIISNIFTPIVVKQFGRLQFIKMNILNDFVSKNLNTIKEYMISSGINVEGFNLNISVSDHIINFVQNRFLSVLIYVLLFILTIIVLKFFSSMLLLLNFVPLIGPINALLGGILGIFKVIIIIQIFFALINLVGYVALASQISQFVQQSFILSNLYDNNLVLFLINYVSKRTLKWF